jgi:hypothetical protein
MPPSGVFPPAKAYQGETLYRSDSRPKLPDRPSERQVADGRGRLTGCSAKGAIVAHLNGAVGTIEGGCGSWRGVQLADGLES